MTKNVLLVGLKYTGPAIPRTKIDVLGLCRPKICDEKAAFALYEYDVIIINPESYSHFLFGEQTKSSGSDKELWELKSKNNDYDLDSAYDQDDREAELSAALAQGSRVIWLLTPEKRIHFFGWRSLYVGYASPVVKRILTSSTVHQKKSRKVVLQPEVGEFKPYFEQLQRDGWRMCISDVPEELKPIAVTPEGYLLGGQIRIGGSLAWLLTSPTSQDAANSLVRCALGISASNVTKKTYHGIFLSHTNADKAFVRDLKKQLQAHGVKDVWLDEAEILVGDSLTKKIAEGLEKTKYIGVVLSKQSIKSRWVEKELEIAMNREISTGEVVVLPLLYERCTLPTFLKGKLYADFTSLEKYEESLEKLLRRLKTT
ncbi:MAG: toll/interleukin-1 receptor domain-containing protein [Proteobacteria bacterium]|nr:toll/interleukin-1 receptor domain-containing protein [Pseudomonadota bacterium]